MSLMKNLELFMPSLTLLVFSCSRQMLHVVLNQPELQQLCSGTGRPDPVSVLLTVCLQSSSPRTFIRLFIYVTCREPQKSHVFCFTGAGLCKKAASICSTSGSPAGFHHTAM